MLVATFFRPPMPPWPTEIRARRVRRHCRRFDRGGLYRAPGGAPAVGAGGGGSVAARGGAAPHVTEEGPDDVRNAAVAFNAMTDQVTRTLESQRHLLSAVGHDLRTPITAMRINLEFVEDAELRERLAKQSRRIAGTDRSRAVGGARHRRRNLAAVSIWQRWWKACAPTWTIWANR